MENGKPTSLTLSNGETGRAAPVSAGDRLREMLRRSGLSLEKAAKGVGYKGASSLQTYVAPEREFIKFDLVEKLSNILVGKGVPPITRQEVYALAGVNPVITESPSSRSFPSVPAPSIEIGATRVAPYGPRDLPVLGQARAGNDEYFFGNGAEVLSLTYRPIELLNVRDAYAVYVHGDSMSPRYEHGEMVYVDPVRPPAPGDDVVVQLHDGQGYIKKLVRRTGRAVICRQFNPAGEVEYPAANVRSVHLIISMTRVRV